MSKNFMAHPSANKDFSEMDRGDLVDYLALRGLSTSGRKIELVALAGIKPAALKHRIWNTETETEYGIFEGRF